MIQLARRQVRVVIPKYFSCFFRAILINGKDCNYRFRVEDISFKGFKVSYDGEDSHLKSGDSVFGDLIFEQKEEVPFEGRVRWVRPKGRWFEKRGYAGLEGKVKEKKVNEKLVNFIESLM